MNSKDRLICSSAAQVVAHLWAAKRATRKYYIIGHSMNAGVALSRLMTTVAERL